MKQSFIDYLEANGWKLVNSSQGVFKFDKAGPYQVYVKNSAIEFLMFNLDHAAVGEPFFSLLSSFTGLEQMNDADFKNLLNLMGIVKLQPAIGEAVSENPIFQQHKKMAV